MVATVQSTFSFPTETLFGAGTISELPDRLAKIGVKRPLVVTDAGLLKTKAFEKLSSVLGGSGPVAHWKLFSDVEPNPTEDNVVQGAKAYKKGGCDGVIAFGGGSALDVGKAVRLLVKRPEMRLKAFDFHDDWSGLAPCICIPTTAGTGSEVGRSSVITLVETHRKIVIFHPNLLARLVILDAELTLELPPKLTAATGIDALTHCIESFTSPAFHPLCDAIALEGIHLIVDALPRAFKNGKDVAARGNMLVAASMGAIAFQKDLGATHSLAHPLSSICGMHHGLANAICLPHVMEFNSRHKPGLYTRVGLACGLDVQKLSALKADRKTIDFVKKLLSYVGIKGGLKEHGVKENQIDALTAQAFADSCHRTNPVPVTAEDLKHLYLAAL
ncbi:MAG TPA: iron-containing alcohol dehydrogenase [Candidatus Saccharimonadales bacterium]|nr:iron-containing alcohol dehydrogenase [Candidatus Saccharimonadales bacterium]